MTWWFRSGYPGHIDNARDEAFALITKSILAQGERPDEIDIDFTYRVRTNNDEVDNVFKVVYSKFYGPWEDNGEAEFGDFIQSGWDANAAGPGNFWIEIHSVTVDWFEDGFDWNAEMRIMDSLGVSPQDPGPNASDAESLGFRVEQIIQRGSIEISGKWRKGTQR